MDDNQTTEDPLMTLYDNHTESSYYDYTTENSSDELVELCEASTEQKLTMTVILTTIFLVVFFLGVIGNALVIGTFALYRRLRLRSLTDVFLFYLALSDLLLLLTLPLQTVETLKGSWVFSDALCKINRSMYAINTYGGLLLLACISVDRYLVVVRARAVRKLSSGTVCYSTLSAIGVALTSIVLSLPDLCFSSKIKEAGTNNSLCNMDVWADDGSKWKLWAKTAKIAGFCVPCLAMLVCYSAIGRVLMRAGGKCWRRQRTLRLMALLVVLFLLFQLPYTVVLLLRMFTPKPSCDQWTRVNLEEEVTRALAYVRCCLNPLLYALVGVRFRNDIIRLLTDTGCACVSYLRPQHDNGSSITPSSPAPTMLSHQTSVHIAKKFAPASPSTKEESTAQTFIFPAPVSDKMNLVKNWCHK